MSDQPLHRLLTAPRPDPVRLGHRQHRGLPLPFQPAPQLVAAVDRVAHHPAHAHASRERPREQVAGELPLGGEAHPRRDACLRPPRGISDPLVRQVQGPVDKGRPVVRGIEQEHPDLLVLPPPRRPAVLARHPRRLGPLLQEAGLIHHHDPRRRLPQLRDHILVQVLCQLPAVLALDRAQQPGQIPARPPPHLRAPKARGDPRMQGRELSRPQLSYPLQLGLRHLLAGCSVPHESLPSEKVYRIFMATVAVVLADVDWNGVNLALVDWAQLSELGEEVEATRAQTTTGKREGRRSRFDRAVRANRQLAIALRGQGLNEHADRFAYRAQTLQRHVLIRQRRFGAAIGSWLLDTVSGFGYKPMRSVLAYVLIVCLFAGAYLLNAQFAAPHLSWDEALVLSISSFHGRGFFSSGISLGDTLARLAAGEAIIGLLIEITFIATFTQRFFAR